MRINRLNNKGDTIVEVLICIAVLSLVVAAAFTLTNRNQIAAQQNQERGEASKIADTQLELLRTFSEGRTLSTLKNKHFCIVQQTTPTPGIVAKTFPTAPKADPVQDRATIYPAGDCTAGVDNRYRIAVWGSDLSSAIGAAGTATKHVFGITVRWEPLGGGVPEEVKVFYTSYDAIENFTTAGFPPGSQPGGGGGGTLTGTLQIFTKKNNSSETNEDPCSAASSSPLDGVSVSVSGIDAVTDANGSITHTLAPGTYNVLPALSTSNGSFFYELSVCAESSNTVSVIANTTTTVVYYYTNIPESD